MKNLSCGLHLTIQSLLFIKKNSVEFLVKNLDLKLRRCA
jgi:hypothetical protein